MCVSVYMCGVRAFVLQVYTCKYHVAFSHPHSPNPSLISLPALSCDLSHALPTLPCPQNYMSAYGVRGIPHAFVIGKDGKVSVWCGWVGLMCMHE